MVAPRARNRRFRLSLESRKSAALQDPGAELVDQLTGLWNQYGRIALGVVGALIVIGVVAFYTVSQGARQNLEAAKKLNDADILYWRGDYPQALTAAQDVAKNWGSTPSGIDAHRLAGDCAFWQGKFKDAITEYRAYLAKRGSGLLAQGVQRSLAYALDSDRQYAAASKQYLALVGVFDRESSAEMLTGSARCELLAQNRAAAIRDLRRVVDEYSETSYATRARLQLAELGAAPS